ncbi:hypothetical protein BJV78DRAFT_1216744 [Lactifluus subvellereus]|nr:hypothetical protein BJV78DRAFT_1216744 [Lactifluus subvellereus]
MRCVHGSCPHPTPVHPLSCPSPLRPVLIDLHCNVGLGRVKTQIICTVVTSQI